MNTLKINRYTEWCSHCEEEVELSTEKKVQECPNCGRYIAPCGMCDSNTCECSKCELPKECVKLNKRNKMENKWGDSVLPYRIADNFDKLMKEVYKEIQYLESDECWEDLNTEKEYRLLKEIERVYEECLRTEISDI